MRQRRGESEEDMEDVLFGKSEEFRRVAPYFPEEVFEHLPDLLAQGVKAAGSYRERDMLLMAMITNISACLPEVRVLYDQVYYSPHLYYMVIAHAGGGRGWCLWPACCPERFTAIMRSRTRRCAWCMIRPF